MALITGSAYAGLSDRNGAPVISGLLAGEAIKAAAPCYIGSDGEVYECTGVSGSASRVIGFAACQRDEGEPVSLYGAGALFQLGGTSMTVGSELFLSDTDAGYLEDGAAAGDKGAVALAISTKDIIIVRANGVHSTGA